MACSPKPPTLSGDLSCVWTKPIGVKLQQIDVMKTNPNTWRPLALQIKDFNDERLKRCS